MNAAILDELDTLYANITADAPSGLASVFWTDRCVELFERAVVRHWPKIRRELGQQSLFGVASE